MTKPLPPCPLCDSLQVMLCEDANNPGKSFARCRECKCQAPLDQWRDKPRHPALAYLLGAVAPLCVTLEQLPPGTVPAIVYKDAPNGADVRVEFGTLSRVAEAWRSLLPVAVPMFFGLKPAPEPLYRLAYAVTPLAVAFDTLDASVSLFDGTSYPDEAVALAFENGNVTVSWGQVRDMVKAWKAAQPDAHGVPLHCGTPEDPVSVADVVAQLQQYLSDDDPRKGVNDAGPPTTQI